MADIEALCQKKKRSVTRKKSFSSSEMSLGYVFLVDEMGNLGLFYRLASVIFVGGSLKPGIGGHNPIESASFGKTILCGHCGPFMERFQKVLEKEKACRLLGAPEYLYDTMKRLLENPKECHELGNKAQSVAETQNERILKSYLKIIAPFLMLKETF